MKRAFQLDESWAAVDAGCTQWVEKVVEVLPEDVATIARYMRMLDDCEGDFPEAAASSTEVSE